MSQVGFNKEDIKTGIILSEQPLEINKFEIVDNINSKIVYTQNKVDSIGSDSTFTYYSIDFSNLKKDGEYYLQIGNKTSHPFKISNNLFNPIRDSLSLFFKVQRCGPTNPMLHLPCHLSDVAEVEGFEDSLMFDVTGGWHDAGDYIKFFSTIAYTTYILLFSYEFDNDKFNYDLDKNDVPDILEEARVGLDWLLRSRFGETLFITQVQDLSDHSVGWRKPEMDTLRYNRRGFTGIGKNQVGIFAATMALASRIWKNKFYDDEFSEGLLNAAKEVYELKDSVRDIDTTKTGHYQENQYFGKLALGATELCLTTKDKKYLTQAYVFADSTEPDFWWSWGNINSLAYYRLAEFDSSYIQKIKISLEHFNQFSMKNYFNEPMEYSWGTTNSFLGVALQAILFKSFTGSSEYDSLAIFQRDFVLGRNRWGKSFISHIGYDYSKNFHSQVGYFNGGYLPGAVSPGPSPLSIIEEYKLITVQKSPNKFNSKTSAYFDDVNNFITNEPTISNNATALFVFGYFSSK